MGKVIFYIDGFNFYYGLKETKNANPAWLKAYWIDMVKLCEQFAGFGNEVEKVIYFTATPFNRDKANRQAAFLNVNKALNGERFEIVWGKYQQKTFTCSHCHRSFPHPEEKRTDVNISVRMIGDAALNKADIYSLVSADSDLIAPITYIQDNFPSTNVKVYFPPSNFSNDIKDVLKSHKRKPTLMKKSLYFFERAHLDDEITINGKTFYCPTSWK